MMCEDFCDDDPILKLITSNILVTNLIVIYDFQQNQQVIYSVVSASYLFCSFGVLVYIVTMVCEMT